MPYIRKGKCVYRKDTGIKVGCSNTVEKAKKYIKVLYANVEDDEKITFNEMVARLLEKYKP
jgi:hypothetical protein